MSGLPPVVSWQGFLDGEIVPGDALGATARIRLIVSPTDETVDEMIIPCSVNNPLQAHTVLTEFQPGNHVRVTAHLCVSETGEALWLDVIGLERLDTAPLQEVDDTESGLQRLGPYTVVNFGCGNLPVWKSTGAWVGYAPGAEGVPDLIEEYEQRTPTGDA